MGLREGKSPFLKKRGFSDGDNPLSQKNKIGMMFKEMGLVSLRVFFFGKKGRPFYVKSTE